MSVPKQTGGFTLVELLVVIGIIAVLLGLLLPVVGRVNAQAGLVKCASNIRQVLTAHRMYEGEYRGAKPPTWARVGTAPAEEFVYEFVSPVVRRRGAVLGQGLLVERKYTSFESLLCPSGDMEEDNGIDRRNWNNKVSGGGSSYVYFYRDREGFTTVEDFARGVTYARLVKVGKRALLMDLNAEKGHTYSGSFAGQAWVSHRRAKKANIGYYDGSVKSVPVDEVVLKSPFGTTEELNWFADANKAYSGK